jgi:transcriptional regulator with XRE-family HTH domain
VDDITRQTEAFIASLAAVLHDLRKAKGLSLTELATKSGLSQPSIGYIEQGARRPTLDSLSRLAISLGTTVSAITAAAEKRMLR